MYYATATNGRFFVVDQNNILIEEYNSIGEAQARVNQLNYVPIDNSQTNYYQQDYSNLTQDYQTNMNNQQGYYENYDNTQNEISMIQQNQQINQLDNFDVIQNTQGMYYDQMAYNNQPQQGNYFNQPQQLINNADWPVYSAVQSLEIDNQDIENFLMSIELN